MNTLVFSISDSIFLPIWFEELSSKNPWMIKEKSVFLYIWRHFFTFDIKLQVY